MNSPGRSMSEVVPDWLVNAAALSWRVIVVVAFAAVVVGLAITLSTVTAAVIIAVIAATVFSPGVATLHDRGWSRVRAAAAVTVIIVLVAAVIVVLTIVALLPFLGQLVDSLVDAAADLRASLAAAGLPPEAEDLVDGFVASIRSWLGQTVFAVVGAVANAASIAILALFTTFFLLLDLDKAWAWLMGFVPADKRERLSLARLEAGERVGRYFRGAAIIATIDALASLIALVLLGVPLAAPMAVLVFFLGFIPYLGAPIAAAAIVLVTWVATGPTAAAVFVAVLVAVKVVERRYLGTMVSGRNAHVHPAVVLVALPIGATVAGLAGVFLVIPIVAMVVAVNRAVLDALDPGPAASRHAFVPGWLDRLAEWSWRLLVVAVVAVIVAAVIASIPILFIPTLFAVFFAATLGPVVGALRRRGFDATLAATAATGGTFAGIVLLVALSVVGLGRSAGDIAAASAAGASAVVGTSDLSWIVDVVGAFAGQMDVFVTGALAAAVGIVAGLALIALLCFLFLRDGGQIWAWILGRLPAGPRGQLEIAGGQASQILSGYMFGTAAIAAFGAITQLVIMLVLGIPLALPLAVLTFFGGFIPYIGSFITTGLAFLVTVATGDTTDIVVMLVFTLVFNIVQGNFVAPLVYGRTVNLHPAIVLLSIPAGAAIAGVTGMILIVPLLGVVATTWRYVLAAFEAGSEHGRAVRPALVAEPVPAGPAGEATSEFSPPNP